MESRNLEDAFSDDSYDEDTIEEYNIDDSDRLKIEYVDPRGAARRLMQKQKSFFHRPNGTY